MLASDPEQALDGLTSCSHIQLYNQQTVPAARCQATLWQLLAAATGQKKNAAAALLLLRPWLLALGHRRAVAAETGPQQMCAHLLAPLAAAAPAAAAVGMQAPDLPGRCPSRSRGGRWAARR